MTTIPDNERMASTTEPQTLTLLVMNRIGVLSRITRVIAIQRANIEELNITKATGDQSQITLVVDLDRRSSELLAHKIERLIEVVEVNLA